jgi:hypothetical protein
MRTTLANEPLDVHAAETADERAAAELGERYAAAVDRDDLKTACELAIKRAAKRLHCGTSQPRATACSGRRAFHAKDEGDLHRCPARHVRAARRAPRRGLARHRGRRDGGLRLTRDLRRGSRL